MILHHNSSSSVAIIFYVTCSVLHPGIVQACAFTVWYSSPTLVVTPATIFTRIALRQVMFWLTRSVPVDLKWLDQNLPRKEDVKITGYKSSLSNRVLHNRLTGSNFSATRALRVSCFCGIKGRCGFASACVVGFPVGSSVPVTPLDCLTGCFLCARAFVCVCACTQMQRHMLRWRGQATTDKYVPIGFYHWEITCYRFSLQSSGGAVSYCVKLPLVVGFHEINETWKHHSFQEMEWKNIDLPRLGGAYFISLLLSRYTIKLTYTQAVNFIYRKKRRVIDLISLYYPIFWKFFCSLRRCFTQITKHNIDAKMDNLVVWQKAAIWCGCANVQQGSVFVVDGNVVFVCFRAPSTQWMGSTSPLWPLL